MAWMGLVTAGFMWKHTKYAILIIFIVAAVITPSGDMWNQSAIAIPMIGLYLISIVLAWIFGRKKKERDVASEELGD
jgi:sec-independent protein translocase protein TatC